MRITLNTILLAAKNRGYYDGGTDRHYSLRSLLHAWSSDTPLDMAFQDKDTGYSILDYLIKYSDSSILKLAFQKASSDSIQKAIGSECGHKAGTPIRLAIQLNKLDMAKAILENQHISAEHISDFDFAALSIALIYAKDLSLPEKLLLRFKKEPQRLVGDAQGTLLHYAAASGNVCITRQLLQSLSEASEDGAALLQSVREIRNCKGRMPFETAIDYGQYEMCQLLTSENFEEAVPVNPLVQIFGYFISVKMNKPGSSRYKNHESRMQDFANVLLAIKRSHAHTSGCSMAQLESTSSEQVVITDSTQQLGLQQAQFRRFTRHKLLVFRVPSNYNNTRNENISAFNTLGLSQQQSRLEAFINYIILLTQSDNTKSSKNAVLLSGFLVNNNVISRASEGVLRMESAVTHQSAL